MRVLHVTRETSGDRRFGLGRSLLPITQALQAQGHEVRYLTQEDLGPRAQAALPRLASTLRGAAGLVFGDAGRVMALAWAERLNIGRLAAKMASTHRWDVVHLHDPWIAWGYRQASLLHHPRQPVRWGITEHGFGCYADATHEEGLPYTPGLLRWLRRLESRVARHADWVVCPTAAARQQLARDLTVPAPLRSWHAVPHARPALTLPARDLARRALGLLDEMPHVVAVGRINPVKRLDAIVRACAELRRPLRLTLLAAEGEPATLHAIAALAPQVSLDLRMVDDVGPVLAAADVYVSAARNESFGMANLEALVAGLPSVCTAVGGVPEVTGGAAWLVPGGDDGLEGRLADAVRALLDNAALRQLWSDAALRQAAGWPQADTVGKRYEAIYSGMA